MKEITINGKATPIHFGMKAIAEFTKRQESDFAGNITTTAAVGSIDSIVALTAVGLNEGARRSGSECRYTEDDVWDIFDNEPHLVLEITQLFVDSIAPLTDKLGGMVKKRTCGGAEEVDDRRITYERWFAIAVGQMSMRPEDFEALTPAEFIYAWLGWSEQEQIRQQQMWERERWAVWVLTSIQLDRKERRAMTEMFPLPWETEATETPEPLTMQERRERIKRILNASKHDEKQ